VARIRALMRRPGAGLSPELSHGDLRLDSTRRQVTRAGRELALNPKEFAVLEVLLAAGGAVVSSEELLERIARLLEPFQRIAPSRTGQHEVLGLGLSIVQAITKAHHARLLLSAGKSGGLAVEIRFPPHRPNIPPLPVPRPDRPRA
jgi:hypothetical protein